MVTRNTKITDQLTVGRAIDRGKNMTKKSPNNALKISFTTSRGNHFFVFHEIYFYNGLIGAMSTATPYWDIVPEIVDQKLKRV
jgi:hypothetical protein